MPASTSLARRCCQIEAVFRVSRGSNGCGSSGFIIHRCVIKRLEHGFYDTVKLVLSDFFGRSIILEFSAGFLAAGTRFQRCLLKQKFFEIVRSVKVGLVTGRYEDWFNLLSLEGIKVDRSKEGVSSE